MKPTTKIAEMTAPDGAKFLLYGHDGEFMLYMNQRQIMTTGLTHSEQILADVGCAFRDKRKNPRVLIGGLGLGFSLRRCLEITGSGSEIEVAELLPEIIRWNRECMDGYNDEVLADARTKVVEADVFDRIEAAARKGPRYDAILLDVDDGPSALIQPGNSRIYGRRGLETLKGALNPGGRAVFWAAESEPGLMRDLEKVDFSVDEFAVAKHARAKRREHRIYLAERKS
jgi:spermidine synthase